MDLAVKVHWRDAHELVPVARAFGARTLEVHLTARDAFADRPRVLDAVSPLAEEFRLVAHQPEWAERPDGERTFVDPSSRDKAVRADAVDALARAAALARDLGARGLVVHPGGVSVAGVREGDPDPAALARSLREVRDAVPEVPLWLENMPWFYGWEGASSGVVGRTTIGRTPAEYAPVADAVDGWCLDFCHAFLAAPRGEGGGWPAVDALLDAWGPRIRHAHASGAVHHHRDAPNPRLGEGVPFTKGDMDAAGYAERLARLPAGVAVAPEIEGGFRDDARGFRNALAWLSAL